MLNTLVDFVIKFENYILFLSYSLNKFEYHILSLSYSLNKSEYHILSLSYSLNKSEYHILSSSYSLKKFEYCILTNLKSNLIELYILFIFKISEQKSTTTNLLSYCSYFVKELSPICIFDFNHVMMSIYWLFIIFFIKPTAFHGRQFAIF